MNDRRVGAYLLYALGEITLIVLGILIAIQLDSAAQARSDARLEKRYISYLINDLETDIDRLGAVIGYWEKKVQGLERAKDYYFGEVEPENPKRLLLDVSYGARGGRGRLTAGSPTFEELLSTGNLGVVRDEQIRLSVIRFYKDKEQSDVYIENARTDYGFFVNGAFPFKGPAPSDIEDRDVPAALAQFKKPEFLVLINKELTFAYSLAPNLRGIRSDAESLQISLKSYLSGL